MEGGLPGGDRDEQRGRDVRSILEGLHCEYCALRVYWYCSSMLVVPSTGTSPVVPSTCPVYWQCPVHCYELCERIAAVAVGGGGGCLRREVVSPPLSRGSV